MNKTDLVAIREGTEEDRNFVYATMLRGLYYGETHFSEIPKQTFMENYHNVVSRILQSPDTIFRVSCLKEDPEVILAYVLLSRRSDAIHFSFCKKAWRNIGLVKSLVPRSITSATHLTKVGLSLCRRKNILYNPFLIPEIK